MTANKHFKRRVRALSRDLGVPYQTALQMLRKRDRRMTALAPGQQLRVAVDSCLPPGPSWGNTRLRLEAPSLRIPDLSLGPSGEVAMVETVPVEFTWELVKHKGLLVGAWQCEVGLWADELDLQFAGGLDRLPQYFKSLLGDECISVRIHKFSDSVAETSVSFRPKLASRESVLEAVNMLGLLELVEAVSHYDGRALCIYRTPVFGSSDSSTVDANMERASSRGYTLDVGHMQVGLSKSDGQRLLALLDSLGLVYRSSPLTLAESQVFAVKQ